MYDAYYSHCREFTPAALVWPDEVDGADDAARLYAGPPREFQKRRTAAASPASA